MANTTWNPADKTASMTLSNGNLTATVAAFGIQGVRTIHSQSTARYYWEYTFNQVANTSACGITNSTSSLTALGVTGAAGAAYVNSSGTMFVNSTTSLGSLGGFAVGNTACIALDLAGLLLWFRKGAAGLWNNSGTANPVTAIGGFSISALTGGAVPAYGLYSSSSASTNAAITANFGDSAFVGAVPAGFTAGLPDAAVVPSTSNIRAMVLA